MKFNFEGKKALVIGGVSFLGRETALDNVIGNCICPGIIKTRMREEILEQLAGDYKKRS